MTSSSSPLPGMPGTIAGSVLPLRRAEELIATLPGVLSVRIVPSETGAIDEVHVLTTDAVPPKATVRNIESALMAQLGLRVNHRKISIATTLDAPRAVDAPVEKGPVDRPAAERAAPERLTSDRAVADRGIADRGLADRVSARQPEPVLAAVATSTPVSSMSAPSGRRGDSLASRGGPSAAEGRRVLIFEDVEVRRSRTKGVLCRVTLHRDDTQFVGEAEGQETERSRVELAARAAIQAIAQAVTVPAAGERSLSLEGAKRIDAFDREFIFVSVTARIGRELVVLTGSCEVRESAETSAVLAVLDATNRWVHLER